MRLLLPTLFLLTATAAAQNADKSPSDFPTQIQIFPTLDTRAPQAAATAAIKNVVASGCPVGFRAEQRGGGQTLWTIALEDQSAPDPSAPDRNGPERNHFSSPALRRPRPSDTGVHVNLSSLGHSMRQVELSVSFLAPGGRVVPLSQRPSDRPPLRKTFTLSAADSAASKLAGDLLIGATAGILRVHLLSIDYADGTSWHPAPGHGCSVEPNRFLPIDAGAR